MAVTHKATLKRIIKMAKTAKGCGEICPWSKDQESFVFHYGNPRKLLPEEQRNRFNHPRCVSCRTVMKIACPNECNECPCHYHLEDWDKILQIIEERKAEYNL